MAVQGVGGDKATERLGLRVEGGETGQKARLDGLGQHEVAQQIEGKAAQATEGGGWPGVDARRRTRRNGRSRCAPDGREPLRGRARTLPGAGGRCGRHEGCGRRGGAWPQRSCRQARPLGGHGGGAGLRRPRGRRRRLRRPKKWGRRGRGKRVHSETPEKGTAGTTLGDAVLFPRPQVGSNFTARPGAAGRPKGFGRAPRWPAGAFGSLPTQSGFQLGDQ